MTESKRIPGFKLTPEQRKIVDEVRRRVEEEKPEIMAESRRRTVADLVTSVQLRGAIGLLKAVRKGRVSRWMKWHNAPGSPSQLCRSWKTISAQT